MNKTRKCYTKDNISLKYSRKLIVPESSTIPVESIEGVILIGEKGKYRLEENGTLIIQNGSFKMTVDSLEKTVLVDYFDKDFRPVQISQIEQDSVLKNFSISKKITSDKVEYNLFLKTDKAVSIKLTLDKKTSEIISMVYNLPAGNYVSETLDDESVERPILILNYHPIQNLKETKGMFSTQAWIPLEKLPLKLNNKLAEFVLYDTRYTSYN